MTAAHHRLPGTISDTTALREAQGRLLFSATVPSWCTSRDSKEASTRGAIPAYRTNKGTEACLVRDE